MTTQTLKQFPPIGHKRWVIPEGLLPKTSQGLEAELPGCEVACMLNTSEHDANVEITVFYSDREPGGPYKVLVPGRRAKHVYFNDLTDPEPIRRGTVYASVIESDVPVIVQHTRLDAQQPAKALMTTMAYADTESIM